MEKLDYLMCALVPDNNMYKKGTLKVFLEDTVSILKADTDEYKRILSKKEHYLDEDCFYQDINVALYVCNMTASFWYNGYSVEQPLRGVLAIIPLVTEKGFPAFEVISMSETTFAHNKKSISRSEFLRMRTLG